MHRSKWIIGKQIGCFYLIFQGFKVLILVIVFNSDSVVQCYSITITNIIHIFLVEYYYCAITK